MKFQKPQSNESVSKGKLEWKPVEKLRVGSTVADISRAEGVKGKFYSFSVSHSASRDGVEKTSRFFRENELNDLRTVLDEVKVWIEADRHELQQRAS